jgi:pyrroloquinoline quinone biosynthesis protein D
MPGLLDSNVPRLATGCRWGRSEEDPMVLFPEGAIRVQGTGLLILQLCDGQRSLADIVRELETQYILAQPGKIRSDVVAFLEQLHDKRIVDY